MKGYVVKTVFYMLVVLLIPLPYFGTSLTASANSSSARISNIEETSDTLITSTIKDVSNGTNPGDDDSELVDEVSPLPKTGSGTFSSLGVLFVFLCSAIGLLFIIRPVHLKE